MRELYKRRQEIRRKNVHSRIALNSPLEADGYKFHTFFRSPVEFGRPIELACNRVCNEQYV